MNFVNGHPHQLREVTRMVLKGIIKKGEYFDSISLMIVARALNSLDDCQDSAVVMGTPENRAILESTGMMLPEFTGTGDTDLLVAIKADTDEKAGSVIVHIDKLLSDLRKKDDSHDVFTPKSLDGALKILPDANLSLISVAGKYAAAEAWKALQKGLHVMLFSDNVPLEEEIRLKEFAQKRDLLVMGPDCGTAIINGVPLAFANAVNRGNIGVVAASGTGLQEVTCLISNAGEGISQAIGTGGRDIKKEVGGIMFIKAMEALAKDPDTKVILLVSKPPHPDVLEKIGKTAATIDKPTAAVFLGAEKDTITAYGFKAAETLDEAAALSMRLLNNPNGEMPEERNDNLQELARKEPRPGKGQKYLRALYSGGTFCSEAQVILGKTIGSIFSNAPLGNSQKLDDPNKSREHTVVDMGADEFTRGKPHPMIDFSTRNHRILEEAKNPETAVILLDVVLGYGSNPDPLTDIVPVIKEAKRIASQNNRSLPIVCSVTGTDKDPQNRSKVVKGLENAGAMVMRSNAEACKYVLLLLPGSVTSRGRR
jgi:FdrA protein